MSGNTPIPTTKSRFLAIAVFLFLCVVSTSAASSPLSCPKADKSFRAFLSRFTDDAAFQESRVIIPLVSRFGDYQLSNQTVELWTLSDIQKQKNPLIYSRPSLKKQSLVQSISLFQPHRYAEVIQENAGEADSTRLLYKFRELDGCWFLEEVHDRSL